MHRNRQQRPLSEVAPVACITLPIVVLSYCSEVARLETAAAQQSQEAAERATERERQLHAARTASAAAEQRAAGAHAAQQVWKRTMPWLISMNRRCSGQAAPCCPRKAGV